MVGPNQVQASHRQVRLQPQRLLEMIDRRGEPSVFEVYNPKAVVEVG